MFIMKSNTVLAIEPENPKEKTIFIGQDDGFYNNKVAGPNGFLMCEPSRSRHGKANVTSLDSGLKPDIAEFKVDNTFYSAGEIDSESTMFDDYPISTLNRINVHHALYKAGLAGKNIHLATGLPLSLFYKGKTGDKNVDFVSKKEKNLLADVELVAASPKYGDAVKPFKIVEHVVTVENHVAWFHLMIKEGADGKHAFDMKRKSLPFGFIDMGGRTTDLLVVENGNVDRARSSSINCGMLDVRKSIKDSIMSTYGINHVSDTMLDSAIKRGKITLFNEDRRVADIVRSAKEQVISRLRNEANLIFGQGADLHSVHMFGGSYLDYKSYIETDPWFKHQEADANPLYVNALGMYKYIRYIKSA